MAENERSPRTNGGPAKSPSRQAPDGSKFTSGKRRVARTAGTAYGTAALNAALEDIAEAPERHDAIYRTAAAMGNLLASGELYEESYVKSVLLDAAVRRGKSYREAERTIRDGINKGRTTPRRPGGRRTNYSRNDATVATIIWWETVGQATWTSPSSATDLRVLAAFRTISLRQGKVRFSASYRQISEEAGVHLSTVQAAFKRGLKGYVRRVEKGHRIQGTSSEWQLIPRTRFSEHGLCQEQATLMFGKTRAPINRPDHDYWNRWPNGWRVYSLLSEDEGLTTREISEITGRPVETVRRIINRLRDKQLATRGADGMWTALPPREGVLEGGFVRNARERRHREQRELWARSRSVLIEKRAAR
jgi:hypothetical protein